MEKLDQYRSQAEQNDAQVEINKAQLLSATKQVDSLKAAVVQAKAAVDQARAGLLRARIDIGHATIKSPIAGRVGDLTARVGQYVQASTRLMSVVPVDDLYIDANFKETQIGLMRIGQPVTVSVDALSGRDLQGRVASFSPGTGAQFALIPPENATGKFTKIVQRVPVRIRFKAGAEARKVLVPGLSSSSRSTPAPLARRRKTRSRPRSLWRRSARADRSAVPARRAQSHERKPHPTGQGRCCRLARRRGRDHRRADGDPRHLHRQRGPADHPGEVGASGSEGTWISTAYLVAEIIIIPLTDGSNASSACATSSSLARSCSSDSRCCAAWRQTST